MIKIEVKIDDSGVLRFCKVEGHAGAGKLGEDIVCAAVSVLMDTALRVLEDRKGITLRHDEPKPGILWFEADYFDFNSEGDSTIGTAGNLTGIPSSRDFLYAIGEFLLTGLKSIEEDHPHHCQLTILNKTK